MLDLENLSSPIEQAKFAASMIWYGHSAFVGFALFVGFVLRYAIEKDPFPNIINVVYILQILAIVFFLLTLFLKKNFWKEEEFKIFFTSRTPDRDELSDTTLSTYSQHEMFEDVLEVINFDDERVRAFIRDKNASIEQLSDFSDEEKEKFKAVKAIIENLDLSDEAGEIIFSGDERAIEELFKAGQGNIDFSQLAKASLKELDDRELRLFQALRYVVSKWEKFYRYPDIMTILSLILFFIAPSIVAPLSVWVLALYLQFALRPNPEDFLKKLRRLSETI